MEKTFDILEKNGIVITTMTNTFEQLAKSILSETPWNQLQSVAAVAGIPLGTKKNIMIANILNAIKAGNLHFKTVCSISLIPTEDKPFPSVLLVKTVKSNEVAPEQDDKPALVSA